MPRRRRSHLRRKKQRSMEFLWPFLLIILVGLIFVLLVQFVMSFLDQRATNLKNKIYLYLDQGTASVLAWGETEWSKAYHGQLILEGDVISMGQASRGLLSFYDGTWVRLDSESKVEIDTIVADEDQLNLDVQNGRAWFHFTATDSLTQFVVMTDHLRITSYGNTFEVGMTDRETVRVLDGEVLVEVLDSDSDREIVLEQIKVGVGQQVDISQAEFDLMMQRQPVSLLEALSDDWKATSWYAWNRGEDANPTLYNPKDAEIPEEEESVDEEFVPGAPADPSVAAQEVQEEPHEEAVSAEPPVVTVTFPKSSPYTLDVGLTSLAITGTASSTTERVLVTSYDVYGSEYVYELQSYTSGDGTWRYNAAYDYDNLHEGRNLYSIVAENVDGVRSEPIEVVIEVAEGAFDELDEAEEETDEDAIEDIPEATVDSGPISVTLISINGESFEGGTYRTTDGELTIVGSVSDNVVAVYFGSYKLSQFVSGSGTWTYYAREDFGNYEPGFNGFTVYAEDAAGHRESLTFEVYWE